MGSTIADIMCARQSNSLSNDGLDTPLDRIDFAILDHLTKNARLSNKELAARVALAPSSCLQRVRRLQRAGILLGANALVAGRALGVGLEALIFVRLRRHARPVVERFRTHVLALTESVGLFHLAGQYDFLVHVAVRDADHLRDLALDAFTTRPEVAHMETHLIFDRTVKPGLPRLIEPAPDLPPRGPRRGGSAG
ncbi:MAG TPA: Lrp/AsnC family transcriptional regulator [Thermoanaerobaculia bacterium]|nr:Lrp/AsnC family transcriptional regulator [Thermoanaerobaculia bacterium]HRS36113.1 Lrp/AsnC family transcriptional regulator [Thermoanaerobaculia bacterium]HRU07934.1 Lrp/AsnC family transcriptional regulator [Thermoanaerobaculia bacterium]